MKSKLLGQAVDSLQKQDLIAHRFLTKFANIVYNARTGHIDDSEDSIRTGVEVDKWFNLEVPYCDQGHELQERLSLYRSISIFDPVTIPPLEVSVLLTIPPLARYQVLVHRSLDGSLIHVEPDHDVRAQGCQVTGILLEKWTCRFISPKTHQPPIESCDETPALRNPSPPYTNYMCGTSPLVNNTIPLSEVHNLATSTFRSLYSLVCALPTSRVCRRARTRLISGLDVAVCISDEFPGSGGTIWDLDAQRAKGLETQSFKFPPVRHPMGAFEISVTYLAFPDRFHIEASENLFTNSFLAADESERIASLEKGQLAEIMRPSASTSAMSEARPVRQGSAPENVPLKQSRRSSEDKTPSPNRNLLIKSPLSLPVVQNPMYRPQSRRTMSVGGLALPNDLSAALVHYDKELDGTLMGGFGVIRHGTLRNGQMVAIKTLKLHHIGLVDIRHSRRFEREVLAWSGLNHPNILPFLGFVELPQVGLPTSLVSPWMKNGNGLVFCKNNPHTQRMPIIVGVCEGIAYLHEQLIVHGDIKAANVVISDDGVPLLCDFGLASVCDGDEREAMSTTVRRAGSARHMAIELHQSDSPGSSVTRQSDMWAFGMCCIELLTSRPPFYGQSEGMVIVNIISGRFPERPSSSECQDHHWAIIQDCWSTDAHIRPSACQTLDILKLTT